MNFEDNKDKLQEPRSKIQIKKKKNKNQKK